MNLSTEQQTLLIVTVLPLALGVATNLIRSFVAPRWPALAHVLSVVLKMIPDSIGARDKMREGVRPVLAVSGSDLYNAYCEASGGLNYQGAPCPVWERLPANAQSYWEATAIRSRE